MLEILCLSFYLVALIATRNKLLLIALIPLFIAIIIPITPSVSVSFSVIAFLYALTALFLHKNSAMCFSLILMSIYCVVFSIDSWINSNVTTWIYNNHEIIVITLHLVIAVSSSSRAVQSIVSCFDNIANSYNNSKRNEVGIKNKVSKQSNGAH